MRFDLWMQVFLIWPTALIDIQRHTIDQYRQILEEMIRNVENNR
jgi:hypothetical protein